MCLSPLSEQQTYTQLVQSIILKLYILKYSFNAYTLKLYYSYSRILHIVGWLALILNISRLKKLIKYYNFITNCNLDLIEWF